MADRVGRLFAVLLSYAMTVGGFLILGLLELYPSYGLLVLFVAVFGPSFGSRGPIISAMTAAIFGRGRSLGVIIGGVSMGMGTGGAVGATMGGLQIGRAHVRTPVTNAHLVCRLLLATKNTISDLI